MAETPAARVVLSGGSSQSMLEAVEAVCWWRPDMTKAAAGYPRSSTISSPGVLVEEDAVVVVDHCRPWKFIFFLFPVGRGSFCSCCGAHSEGTLTHAARVAHTG